MINLLRYREWAAPLDGDRLTSRQCYVPLRAGRPANPGRGRRRLVWRGPLASLLRWPFSAWVACSSGVICCGCRSNVSLFNVPVKRNGTS